MSINSINGINSANSLQYGGRIDQKELEVAKKLTNAGLVSSVQEFMQLSESQKAEKIEQYNKTHPNDPIEHKGARGEVQPPQQQSGSEGIQYPQGSEMDEFQKYLKGKKIKLQ